MTDERGWGLSEQHLLPDVVVAFVDGELSATAHDRASSHMARCPQCLADIVAQRQAASAVQSADSPSVPAGLLATLRAIPQQVETPAAPDGLAMTDDGQLVVVQKPERMPTPFGSSPPLGSSAKLGEGQAVLGRRPGRRTAQGAGVVVSGLVLGALALVTTNSDEHPAPASPQPERPRVADHIQQAGYVLHTTGR
ncbi:anti-sigma factor family protein [Actinophytocola gossypii]|uniref:Zf-HC2 domain-containing protein n=1 Tax=Actinophytocola gossypii TaxID=2812003 RepID=A0ABT2JHS5_9PSEU|nr:zf-HC2 domain-containing protein [Actinophytocola gossypii]MCT2587438.1 zf-HC2 domain-containing protein [Actinophytocola gossypii]